MSPPLLTFPAAAGTRQKTMPPIFIHTLLQHKIAAAQANCAIGMIDVATMQRIVSAAEKLLDADADHDPSLSVWQSGCGLESNRWANQCLAEACEAPSLTSISPATINCNQSTNDTVPTVTHLSLLHTFHHVLRPAYTDLGNEIRAKGEAFPRHAIMGRTYLRDAKPMRMADLFDAWSSLLREHDLWLADACYHLTWLPQGGYSLGNGDGADPRFAPVYLQHLQTLLKPLVLRIHPHPSNQIAGIRALAGLAGALAALAAGLEKIANDVLLLCSGPAQGFGDFQFESAGNDSTTLAGKSNPKAITTVIMACVYARALCTMVIDLAARGQLQLYTAFPLTAHSLLESMDVLAGHAASFAHFVKTLVPCRTEVAP